MSRIRRPNPSRQARKAILISVEDEKSARFYFEKFRDHLRTHRIVVIADHLGSAPKSVVNAAKKAVAEREKLVKADEADRFDEVWVVFDTEGPQNSQREKAARDAIEQARQLAFLTAVSNPCFEYWLLLHFEYFVGPLVNGSAAYKRLLKHLKKYKKGDCCFDETYHLIKTAIMNSEKVWHERYNGASHPCDCHPSTQIHRLVKSLLGED